MIKYVIYYYQILSFKNQENFHTVKTGLVE